MKCGICELGCRIEEKEYGRCRMITVKNGVLCERYPERFSTLFPISVETLPVLHFYPNHKFLQISSVGCNFSCPGCVSEILTLGTETLYKALKQVSAETLVQKAIQEGCKGIAFCINDPAVSFFSFLKLAREAKKNHLLVGFSTNGYLTKEALEALIPLTDFVNIGFKGFCDKAYQECGVQTAGPVFRNFKRLFEARVHVEAAIIHMKGQEEDVLQVAGFVSSLSRSIPVQVMRFVPFGEADMELEPSIRESESLCDALRQTLDYVYLFNSPGSTYLNTLCPDCGNPVILREFFGPMGARIVDDCKEGRCVCSRTLDIKGGIAKTRFDEHGFFGGYRMTRAIEMLQAILTCIGADDTENVSNLWLDLIQTDYFTEFHETVHLPDSYGDIIDFLAGKTGCTEKGKRLKDYINEKLSQIRSMAAGAKDRPAVYYAMGYPLFALNRDRFEIHLVEATGGVCLNRQLTRKGKPGVTITRRELMQMNPDVIFISGFLSCPVSDFYDYCISSDILVSAVKQKRIYDHFPLWDFGSPRWVLGLMHIANTLHPEIFHFDMEKEADAFYREFFNQPFDRKKANRSFYRVSKE